MALHKHQSAGNHSWITPRWILDALGEFDLDPCACPIQPWRCARQPLMGGGLEAPWHGRVWLNPPYDKEAVKWLRRLAEHEDGISLTFARTETKWFFETIWDRADAVLFLKGRLHFHHPDGRRAKANCGAPPVLAAYGAENADILANSSLAGKFIALRARAG